jgi:hypothetical protein
MTVNDGVSFDLAAAVDPFLKSQILTTSPAESENVANKFELKGSGRIPRTFLGRAPGWAIIDISAAVAAAAATRVS